MPKVTIENKTKNINTKTVKDLLSKLSINPDTVLIIRNNQPISVTTTLNADDKLKILKITSQG